MEYQHTQFGYFGVGTFVLMFIVGAFAVPDAFGESQTIGFAVIATLVAITVLVLWFSRLVVTVERGRLRASFGTGWPAKTVELADVVRVDRVRNTWTQGWGVRKIKGGWMYNVWGLDAVEFETSSGEVARIGTDDLNNLIAAAKIYIG